jgi:type IX secretion system PorP/SprF family membrane protein
MIMKKIFAGICWLLVAISAQCQDYAFSQFYTLPLMRNPALCGVFTGDLRMQAVFRNQWQNVTIPFRTAGLSGEIKSASERLTLGIQLMHDVAGDSKLKRIQVLPSVAYHVWITEDMMLTGGFQAGMISSQFDHAALKWDDQFVNGQYDPSNPTAQPIKHTSRNYFDFAGGLTFSAPFLSNGRWYAGTAMYHINKPRLDFFNNTPYKLDQKVVFNMGLTTPLDEFTEVTLFGDLMLQGGHRQLLAGGYYTIDLIPYAEDDRIALSLGAFYRWNDALIPVIKLSWYEWSLGTSYDVNVSKLKTASEYRGGFELTLGYRGFLKRRNRYTEATRCFE